MKRQKGFSLIEAAIVLGIVGLVIGGIWVAASSVIEKRKQARLLEEVITIITNIQTKWKGKPPYSTNQIEFVDSGIVDTLGKAGWGGLIPEDMIQGGSEFPVLPWGDRMRIRVSGERITLNLPVPPASCGVLAPRLTQAFYAQRFSMDRTREEFIEEDNSEVPLGTLDVAATNCLLGEGDNDFEGRTDMVFSVKR